MDLPAHNRASDNVHLVPDGLQQLMSEISREVLRSQPEDLYRFISDYLEDVKKYPCLPHRFDSLDGYETFSSSTPSSIKSYETFTPSSSEVTSYETYSSSSAESSLETEEPSRCPQKSPEKEETDEGTEAAEYLSKKSRGSVSTGRSISIVRSVSTKDTLVVKMDQMAEIQKRSASISGASRLGSKSEVESYTKSQSKSVNVSDAQVEEI